jgi:hypothetical protein
MNSNMPTITLSPEEATVVRHALTAYLSDLRMEVHATDSYEMREELKHEEVLLNRVLEAISPDGAGAGPA